MKNYYEKGKKIGLDIYVGNYELYDVIQNFSLNKENKYVEISYMDGKSDTFTTDEVDVEELKREQREQFAEMERKVEREANDRIRWKGTLTGIYWFASALQFIIGNIGGAIAWLALSPIWAVDVFRSWKLKREMKLVKWTYDNRDQVNEVIHEEVDAKVDKEKVIESDMEHMIPMPIKYEFPENSPYPEEIYNDGIDLNNIDMLTTRQLGKIKRKVLKKNR